MSKAIIDGTLYDRKNWNISQEFQIELLFNNWTSQVPTSWVATLSTGKILQCTKNYQNYKRLIFPGGNAKTNLEKTTKKKAIILF